MVGGMLVKQLGELSILIVDDNEINLMLMCDLLEALGVINIKTVNSGFKAVEEIKQCQMYDFIMMDICMPKLDGYQTTEQIRQLGYEGRVIALTAYELTKADPAYLGAQMDGIILKPIDLLELQQMLMS